MVEDDYETDDPYEIDQTPFLWVNEDLEWEVEEEWTIDEWNAMMVAQVEGPSPPDPFLHVPGKPPPCGGRGGLVT